MASKFYVGQMDRYIALVIKKSVKSTTSGAESVQDVSLGSEFAYMEDTSGTEVVEGKIRHLVNRIYVIRYDENILKQKTNLILIDEGNRFEVTHIIEQQRREYLELRVKLYE